MAAQAKDITVRAIKKDDMANVARIICNSFLMEPLLKNADITKQDNEAIVKLQVDSVLADDLTLIAETKDGTPVAVALSLDLATRPTDELKAFIKKHPNHSEQFRIMGDLEDKYLQSKGFKREHVPRGHTVHTLMVGIEPAFKDRDPISLLAVAGMKHFKGKGYKFVMSEATGAVTKKIGDKFGFKSTASISYKEFFPEGSPYRKCVENDQDAAHLLVKEIN